MSLSRRITLALFIICLVAFLVSLVLRLTSVESGRDEITDFSITSALLAPLVEDAATPSPSLTPTRTLIVTPSVDATPWSLYLPGIQGSSRPVPSPTQTARATATEPPPPTPTPTIPWPPALASPGRSKLGLHVQWNNSPDIMEFIRRMKPAVIKAIDDLGFVAEAKQASPQTVIVARITHAQPTDGDPEALARAFVAENLPTYLAHRDVDYWEGYNEPDVHGRMDWYARFEAERVRAMAENGLRAAVGSFSTGVPEFDDFRRVPARDSGGQRARGHPVLFTSMTRRR